jgi:hypothetical protein
MHAACRSPLATGIHSLSTPARGSLDCRGPNTDRTHMPEAIAQPASLPATPDAPAAMPSVATDLTPEAVLERLQTASRRGRLPGFRGCEAAGGCLFIVAAHGYPFDADLLAAAEPGRLRFRLRMHRRMPVLFAVVLLATIWPGVYFMDELIAQFLPRLWRPWVTYWWYLPLTILPLPWVWKSLLRRSTTSTTASAHEAIRKIAAELGGRVEP